MQAQAAHGETAFGWGNHSTNGYLKTYSETDPRWTAASNSYLLTNVAASTYVRKAGDTMTGALVLPAGGLTVGATQLVVTAEGRVGIGTATPTNALAVNGTIKAREVIVTSDNWPDYVFEAGYHPMPLDAVQRYIRDNGHLPDVPSERDVSAGGVAVGQMQGVLLRKVEEMTLHLIELKNETADLRRRIQELERGNGTHPQ